MGSIDLPLSHPHPHRTRNQPAILSLQMELFLHSKGTSAGVAETLVLFSRHQDPMQAPGAQQSPLAGLRPFWDENWRWEKKVLCRVEKQVVFTHTHTHTHMHTNECIGCSCRPTLSWGIEVRQHQRESHFNSVIYYMLFENHQIIEKLSSKTKMERDRRKYGIIELWNYNNSNPQLTHQTHSSL